MYHAIGLPRLLKMYAFATLVVAAAYYLLHQPTTVAEWWRLISGAVGTTALMTWALGHSPLFPWICRLPLINKLMPDLDGEWTGQLESNWDLIRRRYTISGRPSSAAAPDDEEVKKSVRVRIRARLFFVSLALATDDGYSESETLSVSVLSNEQSGRARLCYIYRNTTRKPVSSDSDAHLGAAYLDYYQETPARLEGPYWTNRNWTQGLNTAGVIRLQKSGETRCRRGGRAAMIEHRSEPIA
jgi:hypothetical protein